MSTPSPTTAPTQAWWRKRSHIALMVLAAIVVAALVFATIVFIGTQQNTSSTSASQGATETASQSPSAPATDAATTPSSDAAAPKPAETGVSAKQIADKAAAQTTVANERLKALGFDPNTYTSHINWAKNALVARGDMAFDASNPTTAAALVQTLSKNASLNVLPGNAADNLDASKWVPVQATRNVGYSVAGGMAYLDANGNTQWATDFVDPAGAILWVNTTTGAIVRALCLNPVAAAPVATPLPPTFTPAVPPKQTPPTTTVVQKYAYVCDTATKTDNVKVTEEQSKDARYRPVGDVACQPPVVVPKNVQRCDSKTGTDNVTISENTAKDTNRYKPVGDSSCHPVVVCLEGQTPNPNYPATSPDKCLNKKPADGDFHTNPGVAPVAADSQFSAPGLDHTTAETGGRGNTVIDTPTNTDATAPSGVTAPGADAPNPTPPTQANEGGATNTNGTISGTVASTTIDAPTVVAPAAPAVVNNQAAQQAAANQAAQEAANVAATQAARAQAQVVAAPVAQAVVVAQPQVAAQQVVTPASVATHATASTTVAAQSTPTSAPTTATTVAGAPVMAAVTAPAANG